MSLVGGLRSLGQSGVGLWAHVLHALSGLGLLYVTHSSQGRSCGCGWVALFVFGDVLHPLESYFLCWVVNMLNPPLLVGNQPGWPETLLS